MVGVSECQAASRSPQRRCILVPMAFQPFSPETVSPIEPGTDGSYSGRHVPFFYVAVKQLKQCYQVKQVILCKLYVNSPGNVHVAPQLQPAYPVFFANDIDCEMLRGIIPLYQTCSLNPELYTMHVSFSNLSLGNHEAGRLRLLTNLPDFWGPYLEGQGT